MADANRKGILAPRAKVILAPLGLLVLFLSWPILFFYFNLGSEILMAPWEYDRTGIPDLGTFPRRVNDFFDGAGSTYFATLLIAANILIVAVSLVRDGLAQDEVSKTRTIWAAALTNYTYLSAIFVYSGLIMAFYAFFDVEVPATPSFDSASIGFFSLLLGIYIVCQIVLIRRTLNR